MTPHFPPANSENESPLETPWSEEHDCVPLKQRLKMLLAKAMPSVDVVVKKEDDCFDSLGFHSDHNGSEARSDSASCKQSQHGMVHAIESSSLQDGMLSKRLEVEYTDANDDSVDQLRNCQDVPFSDYDIEISEAFLDDLDHIVLKERQKMLLLRNPLASIRSTIEHNISNPSTTANEKHDGYVDAFCEAYQHRRITSTKAGNCKNVHGKARRSSSSKNAINRKYLLSSSCKTVPTLAIPPLPNVKVEPLDNELQIPNKDALGNLVSVKSEVVNRSEIFEDIIDHMLLGNRMKLLASRNFSKTTVFENFENSRMAGDDFGPTLSVSSKPLRVKHPRKRRKTVTDSVETALEEDAPGLLKVLTEKGVLVDEIKLYGETESDDALDESLIEESFSELEDVITKIFSQRQSFFKLAPIRCSKGEKARYCLACLISLVEQARYLRFRKWPVEWGWCRDLQSFIFVFEKHNRIVLERPEYGYATYFFELVDALPVHWQIKRLITAMKLTSCSRITLIENRALMIGDDLTEGEARVLMEYGWIPDSGLGTMLNYCDRVVHDRRHESDSSEWRSKIGKLLADGYNGGTLVPNYIPKKLMESDFDHHSQIKLEEE